MRRIALFVAFVLFITGCTPSDLQIQEAIEMTEMAKPTDTSTPVPTNTETPIPTPTITQTITPSPTPNVPQIAGLSHVDVQTKFIKNGFICGDWDINEEGNYEQSCSSSGFVGITDSIIMGRISGRSEDTVFGYFIIFTPFTSFDSWDDLEILIKDMVDYGKDPMENIAWIDEHFVRIKNSEDFVESREYFDTDMIFSSTNSVVSLVIVSSR